MPSIFSITAAIKGGFFHPWFLMTSFYHPRFSSASTSASGSVVAPPLTKNLTHSSASGEIVFFFWGREKQMGALNVSYIFLFLMGGLGWVQNLFKKDFFQQKNPRKGMI